MKFHVNGECYNVNDISSIDLETKQELINELLKMNNIFENLAILLETNMIESSDEKDNKMNSIKESAQLRTYILDNNEIINFVNNQVV